MHLTEDISSALQLLEQLQGDIAKSDDLELERSTYRDLQLLISALDNPALRGQAALQDSVDQLRRQLLHDPRLTVDDFDITFAGRLLLDDGHYSEPLYESAEEEGKERDGKGDDGRRRREEQLRRGEEGGEPGMGDGERQGEHATRPGEDESRADEDGTSRGDGEELSSEDTGYGKAVAMEEYNGKVSTWIQTPQPGIPTAPRVMQTAPPAVPVLSIPVQTTPVLLSAPQSPAILLQIPLLTDTTTAVAGLTINDLYLGRLTPKSQRAAEDAMAMFRTSSSTTSVDDSDRSANGSDASVNSGWSKSSSILHMSYEDEGVEDGVRQRWCSGRNTSRNTEIPTDGSLGSQSTPRENRRRPPAPAPPVSPRTYHPHHRDIQEFDVEEDTVWEDRVTTVELRKGPGGLGFSIGEQRQRRRPWHAAVVVRSLVEGGVARADGRLRPGDRLVSVNGRPLVGGSLDEAVQALRGAPCGSVVVGVLRRLRRRHQEQEEEDHYEEIDGQQRGGRGAERDRAAEGGGMKINEQAREEVNEEEEDTEGKGEADCSTGRHTKQD